MEKFIEAIRNSESLSYAFWLSVFLLLLVSLLKYFVSKESEKSDWGNLVLEFPIDVCLVVITIVITGFMKGENMPLGIILVIVTLVVSKFCCIFRRCSMSYSYMDGKLTKTLLFGLLDVALAVVWVWLVYSKIC